MVEAWGIRGWSLKVWEESLSTGSSQNESCYLILLSTLLRFIRQLLDALQYAANRAPDRLPPSFSLSNCVSPFVFLSFSRFRTLLAARCTQTLIQPFCSLSYRILFHYQLLAPKFSIYRVFYYQYNCNWLCKQNTIRLLFFFFYMSYS